MIEVEAFKTHEHYKLDEKINKFLSAMQKQHEHRFKLIDISYSHTIAYEQNEAGERVPKCYYTALMIYEINKGVKVDNNTNDCLVESPDYHKGCG